MQNLNVDILLLDDETPSLEYSRRELLRYVPTDRLHTAQTVEEVRELLKNNPIELAFLDVELTHSDGFTLTDWIHRNYPQVTVVILTGHVDLGAESYDYEPFDFLVKPVNPLRLERTMKRFLEKHAGEKASLISIDTTEGLAQLNPREILYVAKSGNSCFLHCCGGKEYKVNSTLEKLELILDGSGFFRCHQSFLVSAEHVRRVKTAKFGSTYEAIMDNDAVVPVSRNKYAPLKEFLLRRSMHF